MKVLRFLIPLGVFLAIGVLLASGLGRDPRRLPSVLLDKPAPEFDLPELRQEGQRVSKAALLGKPYLLNVWGSWCVECRVEHPVLTEFAQRGVLPVIGLNWKDPSEDALRWLAQFGDPFDQIAHDPEGDTVIDFGTYGAPETFLIDAGGRIRYKHVGALSHSVIEEELMPIVRQMTGGAQ
jgi:cytochrome c biogenesis protein CcmG/thiol:disulfide interchange protein DsbE